MDDEDSIHRALARTLRQEPYDLLHASDAGEAWAILHQHPETRCVLCDHYMPGTAGLDFLIAARQRFPGLATVLLTAQADLQLVIRAINDGSVHRFFTKPWNGEELRAQIRALMAGQVGPASGQPVNEHLAADTYLPCDDNGAWIIEPPEAP